MFLVGLALHIIDCQAFPTDLVDYGVGSKGLSKAAFCNKLAAEPFAALQNK